MDKISFGMVGFASVGWSWARHGTVRFAVVRLANVGRGFGVVSKKLSLWQGEVWSVGVGFAVAGQGTIRRGWMWHGELR